MLDLEIFRTHPLRIHSSAIIGILVTIGKRLKQRRLELGLTQDGLAALCPTVRQGDISAWETERSTLTAPKIVEIARGLGVTSDWLLMGKEVVA